ncbi:MAG: RCC1 domain-containing protein [Dehalococcoidia bacterium]|nr:RCC1 domain-containing protein [Dehalococcoidia bacterium]
MTVTGDGSAPPKVLLTATTPGISPTASPSGTPLKFASVSAGVNHTCGVTTGGAAYCWGGTSTANLATAQRTMTSWIQ